MKRFWLVFMTLTCLTGAVAVAQETVSTFERLDGLLEDERAAVNAMRQYDQIQQKFIEWDLELAKASRMQGDQNAADHHYEVAKARLLELDAGYRKILARYPENARAMTYHGELLYDYMEEQPAAIRAWILASKLDESLSEPHNNLALHYMHTGEYDKSLHHLDKALKLEPNKADYHFNIAQMYLVHWPKVEEIRSWNTKRVYKEAMKHSKRACELSPDDYALLEDYAVNFYIGEERGATTDWNGAAKAWRTARAKARNNIEEFYTWINEARTWIRKPDLKRAEYCLTKALELRPQSEVAQRLLNEVRENASS